MHLETKKEESLIQQKKEHQLVIDTEVKKLTADLVEINSRILPLRNELQELIKKMNLLQDKIMS